MSNLAVIPIILPLVAGVILAFLHKKATVADWVAQIFAILLAIYSGYLNWYVHVNGTVVLETGGWKAPFGIVIVADSLSAILVGITSLITLVSVYTSRTQISKKMKHNYFYSFVFFLITGVSGAFLTGDLFNLFVFFEVLLMASYALIVIGADRVQLREAVKYMLINLFSSVLFVTAISFLYAVVGTVNMAQIASRVQESNQTGILITIAVLLFFVFATKAALFPLYYWMPNSYSVPSPVVSALFGALLTKVGIYSILRVFTLIFITRTDITHQAFIWIAGLSMLFGVIGALSTNNVKLIVAYNIIPSIGFVLMGIGLLNEPGLSGSVYYLMHDMIIKTALFLLMGAVAYVAGTSDLKKMGGLIHHYPLLGWMLFISAFVLAGIPPFSGFIGKVLLLRGAFEQGEIAIVIISLLTSLLILYSIMKVFIQGFWGTKNESIVKKPVKSFTIPIALLISCSIILGIGAELFLPTVESIGHDLMNPQIYIDSVIKE